MIVLDIKNRGDFYISANFKDIYAITDSIDKYLEDNFPDYFISYRYKNDVRNFHKDFRGYKKKTLRIHFIQKVCKFAANLAREN